MKRLYPLILALPSLLIGCKTVTRAGFEKISEVTIHLPEDYAGRDAKVTFVRLDSTDTRIVKGKDLNISLPSGTYSITLVLMSEDGTSEEFKSCDTRRPYVFTQAIETAIVDICKSGDSTSTVVTQTIQKKAPVSPARDPAPTPVGPPPPSIGTGASDKFSMENTCFGLKSVATLEGNEVLIQMTDTLKDRNIVDAKYLRCSVTMNVPKTKAKIYSPIGYQIAYEGDDKTLKQNFWFMADARDDAGNLALPCDGFLVNANTNSKKVFICSFYDTRPDHLLEVFPKTHSQCTASCAAETTHIVFNLTLAGPDRAWFYSLKIPEIRIQLPETEACPK
ncbi:MAG: hypothetical protein H7249_16550 [Chitinophagaceae bacterium]|nr:hypothetical protein [Oligoflexus sp.]